MSWLKTLAISLSLSALTSTSALAADAIAEVESAGGETLGTVTLSETPEGVFLLADLKHLPPGGHGFHNHEQRRLRT